MRLALGNRDRLAGGSAAARLSAVWLAIGLLLVAPVAAAATTPEPLPDLAAVVIEPSDLPPGFTVSDDAAASFTTLAHRLAGSLDASPDAGDVNAIVLQRTADGGAEFVTSILVAPIGATDRAAFDASAQQASRLIRDAIGDTFGDATVTTIEGMHTGVTRFALSISAPDVGVEYRAVAARRGPVIVVIGHAWTVGTTPVTSLEEVASVIDARLAAAVGFEAPVFRPAGPLVPELTTHIPSPLDLSTDPAVAGTNLVLTALALLLLTVSSKLATRMLSEHEETLARRIPLVRAIARLEERLGGAGHRVGGRSRELVVFAGVALFYGVVFSLLEPGWEPWSLTGLWLLVSFTVASGIVGMADDLVAWRVARRWGVGAGLAVRPTSALVAVASVGLSRFAAVVPGLMFGTPDALRLDEEALGEARARRLAAIGVIALVAVGGTAWAATTATTGMARAGELTNLLAGLEALLLLIFASALQNLFVVLLGMRGSAGAVLRARSPIAWGAALTSVTFLFFHALLNPQGDPGTALANRNVQVILGLVGAFSAATFAAWAVLRLSAPRPQPATAWRPAGGSLGAPGSAPMAASTDAQVTAPQPATPAPGAPIAAYATVAMPALPAIAPRLAGPRPAALAAPAAGLEVSIGTADAGARGRADFRVVGGWVVARTQLVDPLARRQLLVFVLLSAVAWLAPFVALVLAGARPADTGAFAIGFLAVATAWMVLAVAARLTLERHVIAHTAVFPARAVVTVQVGRDWNLGCALTILLTPLIGLLYLLFAGGRVVRVIAPLAADRAGPVTLRLKGSEAEARYLEQLLITARSVG